MNASESYVLTCCSTTDMPPEFFTRRHVHYVPFHFTLDGAEYPDDLGKSVPFPVFYQKLAGGATSTTSQVNVDEFRAFWEPFLQQGQDVLHISLSSGISGEYHSACIARDDLRAKYPQRKIDVVDSLGASSGYGLLMDRLADRRDAGDTFDHAFQWAQAHKLTIHHWFFSTDLTFYIRGGRISRAAGLFGTVLGICPLLNMDESGHLMPREKIRSKPRVIRAIVEKMKEHAEGGTDYRGKCFLSHSACLDTARAVADLVEAAFPHMDGPVSIHDIGTVIGSHTGPGTVALFFVGDRRVD